MKRQIRKTGIVSSAYLNKFSSWNRRGTKIKSTSVVCEDVDAEEQNIDRDHTIRTDRNDGTRTRTRSGRLRCRVDGPL